MSASDAPFSVVLPPRPAPLRRAPVVAALDVGSSKICCLIARLRPAENREEFAERTHAMETIACVQIRSEGIKSGTIADMDAAERAIRLAADAAEREAGLVVDQVAVNVSCGRLRGENISAEISLTGKTGESDLNDVLAAGLTQAARPGRAVAHASPIGFSLDGEPGPSDPRGMLGARLGVDMHVVGADARALGDLMACVERCRLSVETLAAAPYAAALASLTDAERESGAALIDMGAGTTSLAVFDEGRLIHTDALAIGGRAVTLDIARDLGLNAAEAERLKTLQASVFADAAAVDAAPEAAVQEASRIARARLEEIFGLIKDRLADADASARRIILTGGASQLPGTADLARAIFGRPVRLGRPLGIARLPEAMRGGASATAVGLIVHRQIAHLDCAALRARPHRTRASGRGYFARIGRWIGESF